MANYLATDTDLAAVASAIRTKGGTSATLAFPTDFISAINALPTGGGGGNGMYATGKVTIASDVSVTATAAAFPGIELSFNPDYIEIWMDKNDFNSLASPGNGKMYHIVGIKQDSDLIPFRVSATVFVPVSQNGYYFLAITSVSAMSSPATGYALVSFGNFVNLNSYPGWEIDSGKFYLRRLAAGNQGILAGDYHYVAYKRGV